MGQCRLTWKLWVQLPWSLYGLQAKQKHNAGPKNTSKIIHKNLPPGGLVLNICMENIQLTLADLASLKNLIEAATERGAYKAAELSVVGGIYDKLTAFLVASQAQLAQQAEAQQPAEPTQGE